MSIVVKTDFVGEYNVSKTNYDHLDTYIEKYEKHYLIKLLGGQLYGLFIADLTITDPQIPQTTRFINLFNAFYEDYDEQLIISEGIRKMLVQFIYFHYVRELQTENSASGTVTNSVELGVNAKYKGNIVTAYNQGVKNAQAIQWYICKNEADYPEENIQEIDYTSGI